MKNESPLFQKIISAISRNHKINAKNTESAQKSLEQISLAMKILSQKADGRLSEKNPDLSARIKGLAKDVASFRTDVSTLAGKTEQAIAQKITCVSSACDALLSGGNPSDMAAQLSDLERLVQQRLRP